MAVRLHGRWLIWLLLFAVSSAAETTSSLQWRPGKFCTLTERSGRKFLLVRVPAQHRQPLHCATAELDLSPYRGATLNLSIRARATDVSKPLHSYNGIKFMLNFVDGAGAGHWPGVLDAAGSFDWKELNFAATIPDDAGSGRLMLGLQESSGEVEFDLGSLRIDLLFAPGRETGRAVYTARVRKLPRLRGVMSPNRNFTGADWQTLKEWKVNLVRAQLCRNWGRTGTERDIAEYDRWINARLDHYEAMFKLGYEKYGLRFIIDLHSPPGGRLANRDLAMFYEPVYAEHFIRVWQRIAVRFKANPAVCGYDLVNEPVQSAPSDCDYWTLQRRAAEAIRRIDPDTPIIIESNQWASPHAFSYLRPLDMPDIIYQCHLYLPIAFTHQLIGPKSASDQLRPYPGWFDGRFYDRETLRRHLAPVRAFQEKFGARIYVGEFSAAAYAPGADRYLADCIALFEEYNWDWSYHAFREAQVWSLEHAGTAPDRLTPSADNPRLLVLKTGFNRNHAAIQPEIPDPPAPDAPRKN